MALSFAEDFSDFEANHLMPFFNRNGKVSYVLEYFSSLSWIPNNESAGLGEDYNRLLASLTWATTNNQQSSLV